MALKKIIVFQYAENDFQIIGFDSNHASIFTARGSKANEAIGDLVLGFGFKFGIKIKTEDRRGRVSSPKKKGGG